MNMIKKKTLQNHRQEKSYIDEGQTIRCQQEMEIQKPNGQRYSTQNTNY